LFPGFPRDFRLAALTAANRSGRADAAQGLAHHERLKGCHLLTDKVELQAQAPQYKRALQLRFQLRKAAPSAIVGTTHVGRQVILTRLHD